MQHPAEAQAARTPVRVRGSVRPIVVLAIASLMSGVILLDPRVAVADAADDFNVALKLYKTKRFDLASDEFAKFLDKHKSDSQRPLAELYLGQALMYQSKFAEARDVFSKFLEANPDHADRPLATYRTAEASYFLKDLKSARASFEDFLSKYPDNELAVWAWQYLGESKLQLADAKGAVEAFTEVVEKFPKSSLAPEAKFSRARAYQALKDVEQARASFRELSNDKDGVRSSDSLFMLATMEFDASQYGDAITAFESFAERYPQDRRTPLAELNTGYANYYLKEYDQAVAAFERAGKSDDQELSARLWAGISRKMQGKYDDAIAILKPTYEKFGASSGADDLLFHWADSQFRGEHFAEAVPLFEQVVERFPTSQYADQSVYFAMEASLKSGDLARAEKLHQKFRKDYATSGLSNLEELLHGRVLLARAEEDSPKPPLSPEATRLVQQAGDHFKRVLKESKFERTTDWARLFLGRAQQMTGENALVLETLKPLNDRIEQKAAAAEFSESYFLTGRSAADLHDWATAESAFERFLGLNPRGKEAAAALGQLAVIKVQSGKESELDALWKRFETAGIPAKSQAESIHAAAELSYQKSRWAEAGQLFARLNELPASAGYRAIALSGIGHSDYQSSDYTGAAAAFGKLVSEVPAEKPELTADAAFMRGVSLDAAGNKGEAAKAYSEGALLLAGSNGKIATAPSDAKVGRNAYRCARGAGRAYAEAGDVPAADAAYADAWLLIQALPDDKTAEADKLLNEWALVNYGAERFTRSDELFRKLLAEHAGSSYADDARHYLAESRLQDGKFEDARKEFQALLDDPKSDDFVRQASLVNLVELAARSEDWKAVEEFARTLLEKYPDSSKKLAAQYRRGEAALRNGNLEVARATLEPLREMIVAGTDSNPVRFEWSEGVWLLLAEVEQQSRSYPPVETLVTEFHTRFPSSKVDYQADEVLGRSLVKRLEFEKAREAFQKAIDSPNGSKTETAARAQTAIADTYLLQKAKDEKAAAREYFKVAYNYEFPELQAAALLNAAKCQEQIKSLDEAVKTYQELVEKFPNASYAQSAKARLEELKDVVPEAP